MQVVPSARGISGSIQSALGGEANKAGSFAGGAIAGKIKGALAAAGIGAALTAGIKSAIGEGAKLEQSIGGIETLFGKSADKMIANADKAFATAGISANTYMEQATSFSASLLQATGKDTEAAAKYADMAIIDMADNANKMGSNIEDIQNAYQGFAKQNYTMLDNLKLGYGGTKGEMERLLQDAEKISGQEYNIDNLADVYEAIHVVQTELGITGTTAEEGAATLSGSFAAMKAAADNFLGNLALGRNIGPSMVALADTASVYLFDNLIPAIGRIFKSLPTAISAFIKSGLPKIQKNGADLITGLRKGVNKGIPKLIKMGPQMIGKLAGGILKAIPRLLKYGGQMVSSLMGGLTKNTPKLGKSVEGMLGKIIGSLTKALPKILKQGGEMVKNLALGLINYIPTLLGTVQSLVGKVFTLLQQNGPKLAAQMGPIAGKLIGQLLVGIWKATPKVVMAIAKLGLTLVKGLVNQYPAMIQCGANMIKGLASGLAGPVLGFVKPAIAKVVNAILTPIRAITAKIRTVVNAVKNVLGFSGLAGKVRGVFESVRSAITSKIQAAKDKVKGIADKVKSVLGFSGLSSKVRGAFEKVKSAITSKIEAAKDKVKGVVDKIKGFFPFKVGKIFSGIKLPKIHVKGGKAPFGIGGKGSLPSFSVSWNKKGKIFDGPSIAGLGEGGMEAAVPLRGKYMRPFAKTIAQEMPGEAKEQGDIIINLNYDASADATDLLRDINRGVKRYRMAGAF